MNDDDLSSLMEAASHWKVAYEIEASKRVEEMRFLEHYFLEEWPVIQRAIRAHMMSIDI